MTSRTNLLVKKFFKIDLWQYVLIIAVICLVSYVFDKWVEAFAFCVSHCILRPKFTKQYHSYNMCLAITISVAFFGIISTLNTNISLISSIPIALFICWIGNLAQDRVHLTLLNNKYKLKLIEFERPNIYSMTESQLREYCKSKKLSILKEDIVIMRVIEKLTNSEIARIKDYSIDTIDYHIKTIKNKGIDI